MEITMNDCALRTTLPAMITSALWEVWMGHEEIANRRIADLREMELTFRLMRIPATIIFDDDNGLPCQIIINPEMDEDGWLCKREWGGRDGHKLLNGELLDVFADAREQWYKCYPEKRPAPQPEEVEATLP